MNGPEIRCPRGLGGTCGGSGGGWKEGNADGCRALCLEQEGVCSTFWGRKETHFGAETSVLRGR